MRVDIHSHSEHSPDGSSPVREMCRAAAERGVAVFAITDHFEADRWDREDYTRSIPASFADIEEQKPLAPFRLLSGIELGQQLAGPEGTEWLLSGFEWDFVIGSLHNTAGDEDFYFMDFLQMTDDAIFAAFKKYYRELLLLAEQGDFDTLAHLTYPYRYLNEARRKREILVRPEQFGPDADTVFEALIRRGKALELNTGSITRTEADRELNRRYFKRYRELGGEYVTVGSDAHTPDRVGGGLDAAAALLRDAGFAYTVYYVGRERMRAPLD